MQVSLNNPYILYYAYAKFLTNRYPSIFEFFEFLDRHWSKIGKMTHFSNETKIKKVIIHVNHIHGKTTGKQRLIKPVLKANFCDFLKILNRNRKIPDDTNPKLDRI